jgi:acyl carrier protein
MASKLGSQNRRRWASLGMGLIKPAQGMQSLQHLIQSPAAQVAVLPIDLKKFGRSRASMPIQPLLRQLVRSQQEDSSQAVGLTLEKINAMPHSEREEALQSYARTQIVKLLGLEQNQSFNPSQLLINLGMDSLMAVELKNKVDSDLKVNLPISFFLEEASVTSLAAKLHRSLGSPEDQPKGSGDTGTIDAARAQVLLDNIDQLSDDDVSALLNDLMEKDNES